MVATPVVRALTPGSSVGPYAIVSFLAAGGMGEIYIARDSRLQREVALKVLPVAYGSDPERLRRFEQEARAAGQLNHPNLLTVHDVGKSGELPYIVTERLEGRTLRETLAERRLPLSEALDYAIQIGRGLAAAHDKGIVHRDLKPSNIFVTTDGHIKIVDFGLAKLLHPEWERGAGDDDTVSLVSMPGVVLGSAGYMSPEQVQGTRVDHRSDTFSFGAILYEMVSGRRAFTGDSAVEVMHSILKDEPANLAAVAPAVPAELRRTIERCLEKKPEDRYRSIRDLIFQLQQISSAENDKTIPLPARRPFAWPPRPLVAVAALVIVGAAIAVIVARSATAHVPAPRARLADWPFHSYKTTIAIPGNDIVSAALSPDGRFIAYQSNGLRLRHLPSGIEIPLLGPGERMRLTFAADGNSIVYMEQKTPTTCSLFRVGLFGGVPRMIADDIPNASSLAVSPSGDAVAYVIPAGPQHQSEVAIVPSIGEQPRKVAVLRGSEPILMGVSWSADGKRLLTTAPWSPRHLLEIDATTGNRRWFSNVSAKLMAAQWLPDGSGILAGDNPQWGGSVGQLYFLPATGDETYPVTRDDYWYSLAGITADARTVAAIRGNDEFNLWKVRLDSQDKVPARLTSDVNDQDGFVGIACVRDRIIFHALDSARRDALFEIDADGHNRKLFIQPPDGMIDMAPAASPDGRYVVFYRQTSTPHPVGRSETTSAPERSDLWRVDADGSHLRPLTTSGNVARRQPSFTPDGQWIVYSEATDGHAFRLRKVSVEGGIPIDVAPAHSCYDGNVSPDGKRITCCCGGGPGEAVLSMDSGEPLWNGNVGALFRKLRWTPDGRGLVFISRRDQALVVSTYDLTSGQIRELAAVPDYNIDNFAFSSDGKELILSASRRHTDIVLFSRTGE